jgi:hypothetical protein
MKASMWQMEFLHGTEEVYVLPPGHGIPIVVSMVEVKNTA